MSERPAFLIDAPTEALIRQARAQRHAEYTAMIGRLRELGVTVRLAGVANPVAIEGILLDGCPFHLRADGDAVELFLWNAGDHPGQEQTDPATGEPYTVLDLHTADRHYRRSHAGAGNIRPGELHSAFSALLAEHRGRGTG